MPLLKLAQHCVITKDVKTDTFCCYVRCTTRIVLIRGINWPKNRCNQLPYTVRTSRLFGWDHSVTTTSGTNIPSLKSTEQL